MKPSVLSSALALSLPLTALSVLPAAAQELVIHSGASATAVDLATQFDSLTFDLKDSAAPAMMIHARSGTPRRVEVKSIDSITAKPRPVIPDTGAATLGLDWIHVGDSQTAGRAVGSASSPGIAFRTLYAANFGKTPDLWVKGISGQPLSQTLSVYNGYADKTSATWVHFQESGDQNGEGERNATDFGATFESMVRGIRTGSPRALISTETAYSFQRESQAFRDWTAYNEVLRAKVADFAKAGTRIYVAEVDRNIKDLVAKLGFSTVILPDGGHYAAVGNLMVALSYFDALGYDVAKLNLAAIPEVSAAHKAACVEIIAKY
ncbi:MAG TPA: SGNH/GDSL hydrolase family protein [Fibrobacteria bacterium]|nr:SGNH/GDSL hydrolase family protein [Fibrobacteria bacterium]